MTMVLAYRELEDDFGPLLAFKECVDSKGSYDHEKDLAFWNSLCCGTEFKMKKYLKWHIKDPYQP